MIYVDSSAVVKMARRESGTTELVGWLNSRSDAALVSSALVEVEVTRALRRYAPAALPGVPGILARLYKIEIDLTVRAMAAAYGSQTLRTLDAIHLATAQLLMAEATEGVEAFVAYDNRLLQAASDLGLPTVSPGTDRS
ncbi:MAG: type II toxin-antitoxin system VapC family toxin [Chloroflexota bacterium]